MSVSVRDGKRVSCATRTQTRVYLIIGCVRKYVYKNKLLDLGMLVHQDLDHVREVGRHVAANVVQLKRRNQGDTS